MAHYKRVKTKPAYNDENDVVDSVGYLDTVPFKQFSADVERAIKASPDPMSIADIRRAMGDNYDGRRILDAIESLANIKNVGITMSRYIWEEPRIAPRVEYGQTTNAIFEPTGRDMRTMPDYQNHGKRETF